MSSKLSDFGGGIESTPEPEDDDDSDDGESWRSDGANITERCIALKADGDRCENARSHMKGTKLCAAHDRANNVTTINDD